MDPEKIKEQFLYDLEKASTGFVLTLDPDGEGGSGTFVLPEEYENNEEAAAAGRAMIRAAHAAIVEKQHELEAAGVM